MRARLLYDDRFPRWENRAVSSSVLACEEWGSGAEVALLLHGRAGSSRSWWQVGPALASHGYRVLAVDFPGHGLSEPDPAATPASFVEAVACAVPYPVALAVGHSMGGSVLARAVAGGRIRPTAAVYVEAPFATPALTVDREELRARYAHLKANRTERWYRQNRPAMLVGDIEAETAGSRAWDIDTAVSLSCHAAGRTTDLNSDIPSLIIRADPSDAIDDDAGVQLERRGFTVARCAARGTRSGTAECQSSPH